MQMHGYVCLFNSGSSEARIIGNGDLSTMYSLNVFSVTSVMLIVYQFRKQLQTFKCVKKLFRIGLNSILRRLFICTYA